MAISANMLPRTIDIIREGAIAATNVATTAAPHIEVIALGWTGAYYVQVQAPFNSTVTVIGIAEDGATVQTESKLCKSGIILTAYKYTTLTSIEIDGAAIGALFSYSIVDAGGTPAQAAASVTVAAGVACSIEDDTDDNNTNQSAGMAQGRDIIVFFNYVSEALAPKTGDTLQATDYPCERLEATEVNLPRSLAGRSHWEVNAVVRHVGS